MMHPLYLSADGRLYKNRRIQMYKGAEKYPEPLNPMKWTAQQLGDHAAQEVIDLSHYVEALVWQAEKGFEAVELLTDAWSLILEYRAVHGEHRESKEMSDKISKFFDSMKGGE